MEAAQAIGSNFSRHIATEFLRWRIGDDIDGAARCVSPIQGALRALEHFYPLKIIEVATHRAGSTDVNTVDTYCDRALAILLGRVFANTTNID